MLLVILAFIIGHPCFCISHSSRITEEGEEEGLSESWEKFDEGKGRDDSGVEGGARGVVGYTSLSKVERASLARPLLRVLVPTINSRTLPRDDSSGYVCVDPFNDSFAAGQSYGSVRSSSGSHF